MAKRYTNIMPAIEKFNKIITNSHFINCLDRHGICLYNINDIFLFWKNEIDKVSLPLTKKQYTLLAISFTRCNEEEAMISYDFVMNSTRESQKGLSYSDRYNLLYGKSDAADRIKEYYKKQKDTKIIPSLKDARKNSHWCVEHWIERGFREEEAKNKISEIQRNLSKRRDPETYKRRENYSVCIEYWLHRGYSEEDSKIKLKDELQKCNNSLDSCIKIYGEEEGLARYKKRIDKLKTSLSDINVKLKMRPKYKSKEAIKFFIPHYKMLRRLGISKDDIYWNIGSRKEYFINSFNKINFYDFTIRSKKVIIEYHGIAWHPKNPYETEQRYLGSMYFGMDIEEAYNNDMNKIKIAEENGFKILCIYSDNPDKHNIVNKFLLENCFD